MWKAERNEAAGGQAWTPAPIRCNAMFVGLLSSVAGRSRNFIACPSYSRAILSRRCLRWSARLALIEPIAHEKSPVMSTTHYGARYINPHRGKFNQVQ